METSSSRSPNISSPSSSNKIGLPLSTPVTRMCRYRKMSRISMGDIRSRSRLAMVNMLDVVSSKAGWRAAGCQCGGWPSIYFD